MSGKHYSLPFLPATPLSQSRTLQGHRVSSTSPRLASCVASRTTEIQGHQQVCRARRQGEVPGHSQQQLTRTLIVRLLKTHFLHQSLIVKSKYNRIELVTRPTSREVGLARRRGLKRRRRKRRRRKGEGKACGGKAGPGGGGGGAEGVCRNFMACMFAGKRLDWPASTGVCNEMFSVCCTSWHQPTSHQVR